jgi:hypothetical protein
MGHGGADCEQHRDIRSGLRSSLRSCLRSYLQELAAHLAVLLAALSAAQPNLVWIFLDLQCSIEKNDRSCVRDSVWAYKKRLFF